MILRSTRNIALRAVHFTRPLDIRLFSKPNKQNEPDTDQSETHTQSQDSTNADSEEKFFEHAADSHSKGDAESDNSAKKKRRHTNDKNYFDFAAYEEKYRREKQMRKAREKQRNNQNQFWHDGQSYEDWQNSKAETGQGDEYFQGQDRRRHH